jgi:hypothetical protein
MKRNSPNWSRTYETPLALRLYASPRLGIFSLGAHLFAFAAVLDAGIPWVIRGLLVVAVGVSLVHVWRRHVARIEPSAVRSMRLTGEGSVECEFASSAVRAAMIAGSPFIHPWLVLLRIRTDDGVVHPIVIARDAARSDEFHRLRVYLRQWRGS